jgi:hypothetical protein
MHGPDGGALAPSRASLAEAGDGCCGSSLAHANRQTAASSSTSDRRRLRHDVDMA